MFQPLSQLPMLIPSLTFHLSSLSFLSAYSHPSLTNYPLISMTVTEMIIRLLSLELADSPRTKQ
jgi:hypothetical protein